MADSNEIKQTPIKQDEEQFENGFAPIASFTQRINALSKSGKLEYPKYRTLSEEQTRSYEKAKDLPEYQRKAMVSDVVASDEQTAWQNAKNSAIIYAMDALSGAKTELALGNMLVSDDYTPLIRTGAEIAGGAVGYETAKQAGKGALKRLAGAAIGGAGAGAIIGALTPSSTVSQEEEYESLLKSGWKPVGKSEKDFAKNQLRAAGLSEEEIADLTKPSKLKTIGKSLLQAGWDKVNYKASISPRVDEDSLAAFITQGALSMGEYLLIGAGGKILGTQVGRAAMRKANITPTVATRLKNITGKDVEPTRLKGVSKDALERKAQSIGVKAGQTAASTNMAVDVIGGGAVASIQKYVEETGDVNLDNYTADIRNVAIDAYSAYAQGLIENKLGAGKILGDKRLVSKWGEWLNGFVQEFTQGEVNDIAEWTKGNATLEEIVKNIPANIASGILGSFLQGSMGTAVYAYHHKKNVDDLTSVIMAQSTKENPIDEKKARQFAEQKVNEVESGVAQNLAKDLINFTGAGNYQGKIFNTIRDNVEKATKYQQEIMKDTLEGSNYDSMSEDDLALHIESVAEDNTDRAVIDALERKIPLSESPLLKGETLDGSYYIEGSDYAKETARQARQARRAIHDAVYASQQVEESAKKVEEELKKVRQELHKKTQDAIQSFTSFIPVISNIAIERAKSGEVVLTETLIAQNYDANDFGRAIGDEVSDLRGEGIGERFFDKNDPIRQFAREWMASDDQIIALIGKAKGLVRSIKEAQGKEDSTRLNFQDPAMQESFDIADENARLDAENKPYDGEFIRIIDPVELKQAQFEIVQETNPMQDDYHVGIRSVNDIKTFDETINDEESFVWGDYSREDAQRDLAKNEITVYSSYPIENGVFVSTSYRQAEEYAGGKGSKVYERTVPLDYVAWINGDEGQFAMTDVVGKKRPTKNSDGQPIAKSEPALRNFWKWFGDSKVVDENGRPLVVYHGTNEEFDEFDIRYFGRHDNGWLGVGFYTTNDEEMAESYGSIVMPLYTKLENPYILTASDASYNPDHLRNKLGVRTGMEINEYLRNNGYDGVLLSYTDDWGFAFREAMALERNQIKSTQNRGTFSPDTGNIYYQDNQRGKGGAFDPRTRSITLGAKANAGTWEHEFAHYWVNVNFKWARSGKASVAWMNQWRAVEKWLGIDPEDKYLDGWASEKFARAYERFLAEEELPLVLKKSMADFRDFILDHYDFELDDAKGLQDKLGRPIKLNESTKEWFRKSVYKEYMSPTEMAVVNERLALDDQERKDIGVQLEESAKMQSEIATAPELNKIDISGGQIQREAGVSNNQILGKRTIGGGEEKESKGQIAKELGKTYESTNWEIQEQLVNEYLETVSVDEAIEDLDNETYPEKIDANFLRQALVEQLLDQGRELEAVALIEQTADDFTQAAQTLQAARKINTPFTNAVRMLSVGKAEKLAQARYGRNANAVAELDKAMNALIDKYESDFMNAQTEEERELVYAALQDEAIRTIGTLDKSRTNDLDFQDVEDKEERKQAKAIRKQQIRRASIKGYRSRAKRALKQALGIEPTRQQVREIKRLAAEVAKEIRDFRKAVAENKTSAIDPTKVLVAQNKLNEYMNKQLPPRVLSTLADATNSFMMANMLWNPATNVFNIESTLVQMIPHLMASTINYGGGVISWPEKAKLIKQALVLQAKTGYNIFSLRDFFDKKTIWAEKYYEPTSKLGKAQRFPLTALGLMDTMNKGIVFLHHADSMATKQAKEEGKKNGWTDSQVKQRAKELFYQALNTDPRTITMDGLKIRQASVKEGEEATFTQMTKTAEMVNKFRKILNLGGKTGLGNIIMPFTTTVANIAEDTVLNYGLGAIRGLVKAPQAIATQFDKTATAEMKKEAWKAVQPETKNVIKNAIGVIMLLSIALSGVDDEEYVLGYDRQTDMDKDIRNNRNAPYGYAIRIGDKWIDLDLFGIGSPYAKMYLIAKRHGFTSDGWIKGIASNIDLIPGTGEISSMYNKYTQKATWEDSTSAWKELGSEKTEEIAVRLIPASALFGQIGNIMDDKKRESWNNWYDKILVKIPELRETLPARTSTQTGKEIPQTDSWANLLTGQRIKDYVESNAADRARYEFALEDKALSYREGNSKLKELGKDTKRYKDAVSRVRKLFTEKLEAESKKTSYQRLSIKEKREIVNKLHKEALEDVKRKLGLAKPKKRK